MQLKIALCDDSEEDRRYIEKLVRNWAEASGESVGIQSFPSAEAFLFHYEEEKDFAILLLDIEMGKMSGLELCRALLEINPRTNVVYLTAYSDYAVDAWGTGASGFMRKPITQEGVQAQLKNLRYPFSLGGAGK